MTRSRLPAAARRFVMIALLSAGLITAVAGRAAEVPFAFSDPAQQERFQLLLAELRCLVCQNQSLADSNADLAQDLRQEVYRMMQAGQNDESIIEFMVARYGDFVLYRPPIKPATYLLWFGPALLLVLGALVLVRFVRRRGAQAQTSLTAAERREVTELLERSDTENGR